jgi:hypothetical protein
MSKIVSKQEVAAPDAVDKSAHREPITPGEVAAQEILAAHQSILQHSRIALAHALWIGRALCRLRKKFRHKEWGMFRSKRIEPGGMSNSTIKRYMQMWGQVSPEKGRQLPESLADIKVAGIDKLELPAATVTGVYRAFGMIAAPAPAKSSSGGGKPDRGPDDVRLLEFTDPKSVRTYFADVNDVLSLEKLAKASAEDKKVLRKAMLPVVQFAETVGIEPKRINKVCDTMTALTALRSVGNWLKQGLELSDASRDALRHESNFVAQCIGKPAPPVKELTKKPRRSSLPIKVVVKDAVKEMAVAQ